MRKSTIGVVAFCVLQACQSEGSNGIAGPSQDQERPVFSVVLSEGVSGYPTTTREYNPGEVVDYSYSVGEGYVLSGVILDGNSTELSGSLVMNDHREIVVAAEPVVAVPTEDMSVVNSARALLASPSPDRYRLLIAEVSDLYERYGGPDARGAASAAFSAAFASASESSVLSMRRSLAGETFQIGGTAGSLVSANVVYAPNVTDIFYVNGIWTVEDEASVAANELEDALSEMSLPGFYSVRLFYNNSETEGRQKEECLFRSLAGSGLDIAVATVKFAKCWGVPRAKDVAEATVQVVDLLSILDNGSTQVARDLARKIDESRSAGRNVIIVGHSQGSLVAEEAINMMPRPDRCVAALAVGAPIGPHTWALTDEELSGVSASGQITQDIILGLGLNFFDRYSSDITDDADEKVASAQKMSSPYGTLGAFIYLDIAEFWQGVRLHSIMGSYLAGDGTRKAIVEQVASHIGMFGERKECSAGSSGNRSSGAVFGVSSGSTSSLWSIDPASSGLDSRIGSITGAQLSYNPFVEDVAVDADETVWGLEPGYLYEIDQATAEVKSYVWYPGIGQTKGLASGGNGLLYTLSSSSGNLIAMDPVSGAWGVVGSTGLGQNNVGDLAFGPNGTLYATMESIVTGSWALATIDTGNGRAQSMVALGEDGLEGLFFSGGDLYATSTESWWLVKIDPSTGETTRIRQLSFSSNGAGS